MVPGVSTALSPADARLAVLAEHRTQAEQPGPERFTTDDAGRTIVDVRQRRSRPRGPCVE